MCGMTLYPFSLEGEASWSCSCFDMFSRPLYVQFGQNGMGGDLERIPKLRRGLQKSSTNKFEIVSQASDTTQLIRERWELGSPSYDPIF